MRVIFNANFEANVKSKMTRYILRNIEWCVYFPQKLLGLGTLIMFVVCNMYGNATIFMYVPYHD